MRVVVYALALVGAGTVALAGVFALGLYNLRRDRLNQVDQIIADAIADIGDPPEPDDRFITELRQRIVEADRVHWDTLDDAHFDLTVLREGRTPDPHELPSRQRRNRRNCR